MAHTQDGRLVRDGEPQYHLDQTSEQGTAAFWGFSEKLCEFLQERSRLKLDVSLGPEGPDRQAVYRALFY